MSRPVDWTPLQRDSDPVPGEPYEVERSGRRYQNVADAIETAASRLREIANDSEMQSDAVAEFRGKAHEVADDIERAHERYRGVGDALVVYAGPLATAQTESSRALEAASTAQGDLADAERRREDAQSRLDAAGEGTDTSEIEADLRRAERDVETAEGALAAARRRCDDAVGDRDDAAATAIEAIREVEDSGDLNDGWWDDWGSKVVETIAQVAGAVAAVAGVAALLVGWIPVIGQALAGILGTIALIAGVVSLLANLALASTGYGDWTNVVLDVISVATFGLGRAVVAGGRAAMAGTRGAARLGAGRIVGRGAARSIRSLTGSRSIANLSRNQARSLVRQSNRTPLFSLRAPFSAARRELAETPSQLRTVLDGGNWSRALDETPDALRSLAGSSSMSEALARFTQNADALGHVQVMRGLDDTLAATGEVTAHANRASEAIGLGQTSVATGGAVDGFQFSGLFGGADPPPSESLNLPKEP